MKPISKYFEYLVLLIAGGIAVFAFAPFDRGVCLVISIFALMWVIEHNSLKRCLIGAFCYGLGFFIAQLYWLFYSLYSVIQVGLLSSCLGMGIFFTYLSLYPVFTVYVFKKLQSKSHELNYLLLFPSCWVLSEWLRGIIFTGFPWTDVAYTQVSNYLLQGFFPLVGSYGVSWLTMSILGFLFIVITNHQILIKKKAKITMAQRLAVLYFVLIVFSAYLIEGKKYTQEYGQPVKVALVQANINGAEKWDVNRFLQHLDTYAKLISQSKAEVIFLPETAIPMYMENLPAHYLGDIVRLANLNHAQLVIGMPHQINARGDYVNSATLVTSVNHPYYAKAHLVPYGEYIPLKDLWGRFYLFAGIPMVGFSAGSANAPALVMAKQKFAFNICYENGFGSELIKSAANASIMANLSDMVWYGKTIAAAQHLQISQARALENQRYFIQDTNTGVTAIINPYGKVEARLDEFSKNILISYVQGRVGVTPYQRLGNYPIILWMSLLLLIALIRKLLNLFK